MIYPCWLVWYILFVIFLLNRVSTEWGKLVPSLNHLGWVSHRWRMPYFQLLGWPMDDGTGRPFKGVGRWNWIQHGRCMYHYVSPRIFAKAKIIRFYVGCRSEWGRWSHGCWFLSRNLEERSLWSWIRGFLFVTWVHGRYSREFKTLTENGKHGSWHGFGMIWKTSRHIASVFESPGIQETDNIFGWDSLLWPPTLSTQPLNSVIISHWTSSTCFFCLNGFLFMFHASQWVHECHQYIIAHPPFLALKIPRVFSTFQVDNLHKDDEVILDRSGEKTKRWLFVKKDAVDQLKLGNYIHDTLKKLDLLFKL